MDDVILKLEDITKVYSNGVVANKNINIEFSKGEIHSVIGENGAGKSTLMKIIFANEKQTSGNIYYKGELINYNSSLEAINNGIGMVYQHFKLIPSFSVAQNIILGFEPRKDKLFLDKKKSVELTQQLAKKYNFDIDVNTKVQDLTVSAKQKVEILKTLYRNAEIIILDEPTAVLTPQETKALFEQLLYFKELGHTIIFISHKLNEVKQISDKITVISNGETKGTFKADDVTIDQLTELIIGRKLESSFDTIKKDIDNKKALFNIENLVYKEDGIKKVDDVSFSIAEGEILGIAGVQGNGQEELVKMITGLLEADSGKISLNNLDITKFNIKSRRDNGLAFIPEDRMVDGVASGASVSENIISTYYDSKEVSGKIFLKEKNIKKISKELIGKFSVRTKDENSKIESLSGGNIQKVVVAREWNTAPLLMVAEQPTRGIDVGSARYIHELLIDMRNSGKAILLISADLNEVMSLSDRLLVMFDGKIVGHFNDLKNVTENELGLYMLGTKKQDEEELRGAVI
ncbi:MAG: ABC transporter ATP-binding protein [Erysipelotrichaceae bacterium]|nr:ABC transporter ATP-binding protein [Erysipelotrichaceae bacterium]